MPSFGFNDTDNIAKVLHDLIPMAHAIHIDWLPEINSYRIEVEMMIEGEKYAYHQMISKQALADSKISPLPHIAEMMVMKINQSAYKAAVAKKKEEKKTQAVSPTHKCCDSCQYYKPHPLPPISGPYGACSKSSSKASLKYIFHVPSQSLDCKNFKPKPEDFGQSVLNATVKSSNAMATLKKAQDDLIGQMGVASKYFKEKGSASASAGPVAISPDGKAVPVPLQSKFKPLSEGMKPPNENLDGQYKQQYVWNAKEYNVRCGNCYNFMPAVDIQKDDPFLDPGLCKKSPNKSVSYSAAFDASECENWMLDLEASDYVQKHGKLPPFKKTSTGYKVDETLLNKKLEEAKKSHYATYLKAQAFTVGGSPGFGTPLQSAIIKQAEKAAQEAELVAIAGITGEQMDTTKQLTALIKELTSGGMSHADAIMSIKSIMATGLKPTPKKPVGFKPKITTRLLRTHKKKGHDDGGDD